MLKNTERTTKSYAVVGRREARYWRYDQVAVTLEMGPDCYISRVRLVSWNVNGIRAVASKGYYSPLSRNSNRRHLSSRDQGPTTPD